MSTWASAFPDILEHRLQERRRPIHLLCTHQRVDKGEHGPHVARRRRMGALQDADALISSFVR